jgi:hypothetical protein
MSTLDPTIIALAKAIKYSETGAGDTYNRTGGSGEYGAYQFMPSTYRNYAQKYLGNASAQPTVENQNRIAYSFIQDKKTQGYNPAQIASMWNAGEGRPDAYKQNWKGVNSKGVSYDTPAYVRKVSQYYQQFKEPLASQSNYVEPVQAESPFTMDMPVVEEKSFLRKVGDFFTGSTQKFGKTIGEAIASGKNVELYAGALQNYTKLVNDLQIQINSRIRDGQDTSKLAFTLQNLKDNPPDLKDFTGDVINKTTKQILGEAGGTLLEMTSGGLLSGGTGLVKGSGTLLKESGALLGSASIGQKVLQGAKIGATYGAIGSGTYAMQENKSTGNILLDSFVGGILGAGLGAVTAGAGGLIGKRISAISPTEKAFTQAQTNVAKAYEKALNLTPSQRAKEQALLERTGDNVFTTLVKNHINLGSNKSSQQLDDVASLYEKAIQNAQKSEHALFNLNELTQSTFKEIDERVPSATAREEARKKILTEISSLLKEGKGTVIKNPKGETLVDSSIMERLRKTGNSWTPFNASDPERIGRSTGYALANAVRDNVEKYGTFPAYRGAMREWGKIIHVQQVLGKLEKSGKHKFRVLGGLSGAISRRVLTGALGYHTGGLGGLILGELGGEYGAMVVSNPRLKTYLDRLIIKNFDKKVTPEIIATLSNQVKNEAERLIKLKQIPARTQTKAGDYPINLPKSARETNLGLDEVKNTKFGQSSVESAPITKQTTNIPSNKSIPNNTTLVDSFVSKSAENKPIIDTIAKTVADKYGVTFVEAPLKTSERINAKVIRDYGGDYENINTLIKDGARNTILSTSEQLDNKIISELLKTNKGATHKIQSPENFNGYKGNIVRVPMKNGLLAEIQVHTPEMLVAKFDPEVALKILGKEKFDAIVKKSGVTAGLGHKLYELEQKAIIEGNLKDLNKYAKMQQDYYLNFR